MCLIKLVRLQYVLTTGYFPFLVGHRNGSGYQKGTNDSDHSEKLSFREHGNNQRALSSSRRGVLAY